MKSVLVIGSAVADVLLRVPRLPARADDVIAASSHLRLGGCAFNTARAIERCGVPNLLCSPAGSGVYGDFAAAELTRLGRAPLARLDEANGCCYCLVEPDGERTFLSVHGAEYRFRADWIDEAAIAGADSVFVCGLELEEADGGGIAGFVEAHPALECYFAPGPRIARIPPERMERLLEMRPALHLNLREAREYTGEADAASAAERLRRRTGRAVVVTCGAAGAYWIDGAGRGGFEAARTVKAADTTGAGDAHCGTVIARLKQGYTLREAVQDANRAGAEAALGGIQY